MSGVRVRMNSPKTRGAMEPLTVFENGVVVVVGVGDMDGGDDGIVWE